MVSDFARAAAALKNTWIVELSGFKMVNGGDARIAVCARPVNDPSFIASAIFEVLPQFTDDDTVWLEIISQLERIEHIN